MRAVCRFIVVSLPPVRVSRLGMPSKINPPGARLSLGALVAALLAIIALVAGLPAATGDTIADAVLGQPDFVHQTPNTVDPQTFASSSAVAVDVSSATPHLYVADTQNNRVLGYQNAASFANGAPADLVIGQPDLFSGLCNEGGQADAATLCGPLGVAVDGAGNLYVADTQNNRVLEYNPPFNSGVTAGQSANLEFGQGAGACDTPGGTAPAA